MYALIPLRTQECRRRDHCVHCPARPGIASRPPLVAPGPVPQPACHHCRGHFPATVIYRDRPAPAVLRYPLHSRPAHTATTRSRTALRPDATRPPGRHHAGPLIPPGRPSRNVRNEPHHTRLWSVAHCAHTNRRPLRRPHPFAVSVTRGRAVAWGATVTLGHGGHGDTRGRGLRSPGFGPASGAMGHWRAGWAGPAPARHRHDQLELSSIVVTTVIAHILDGPQNRRPAPGSWAPGLLNDVIKEGRDSSAA